ncbi:outer membrane beta-barrel protein [Pleionea sediminis]|uniref:outer membrane beta-barrel protein n=1 Tax=Pleionea sediminis TaxID=2569479 RepID=UPI0013DD9FB7|nr:outer membrane beta-barrel protein [Pleionea sediminis]
MNKKLIGLSAASLLSMSLYAGDYVGVSYKMVEVSEGSFSIEPSAIDGKYGHMLTNNIALESRFGIGVADDEDVGIDSMIGIFGAYHFKLDSIVTPYAIAGFSSTELSVPGGDSVTRNDFSYGIGADISIDKKSSISVEYVQYFDKDFLEGTAISAGWTYSF